MSLKLTIFVLVIFYNLITAFLKKRAKKKLEEAERNGGAGPRGATVSTSTEEVVARKREVPVRTARSEDEEIVQSWDEKSFSAEEEEAENPYREMGRPKPSAMKPAPSAGKDLLTQLAREIGLQLPEAPSARKPAPAPGKAPVPPASKGSAPTSLPARNKRVTSYDEDHARTVADSAPGRDMTSAPGIAAVESANAAAYVTLDPLRPTALTALRADLFDGESLRRAFILKTVLDKPLSLQPRSLGAPGSAPHSVPPG